MNFNVPASLFTVGCCLISMIIAGKSTSNENKIWFENLKHPKYPLILKYMNIIGFCFYLLFGYVLYNLFIINDIISIIITIIIIQCMGLSALLLYKTKQLKLFFFTMLVFPILVPVLIFLLLQIKLFLAIPVLVYLLWLVYDLSYFYRLMKLNK